jgi:hypothetical protein
MTLIHLLVHTECAGLSSVLDASTAVAGSQGKLSAIVAALAQQLAENNAAKDSAALLLTTASHGARLLIAAAALHACSVNLSGTNRSRPFLNASAVACRLLAAVVCRKSYSLIRLSRLLMLRCLGPYSICPPVTDTPQIELMNSNLQHDSLDRIYHFNCWQCRLSGAMFHSAHGAFAKSHSRLSS